MDSFVERFKDLATKVQEGFADARGEDVVFSRFLKSIFVKKQPWF